jgi:hypothetical protein
VVRTKKTSMILADSSHAGIVRVNKSKVNIKMDESMIRKMSLRYNQSIKDSQKPKSITRG